MKTVNTIRSILWTFSAALLVGACGTTNPNQPGPAVGRAVGTGVGAITGQAAGGVVGAGEGFAAGFSKPFDPTQRVVRHWRQETTADGRLIQVPEDVLVDAQGRPVRQATRPAATAPASNPPSR